MYIPQNKKAYKQSTTPHELYTFVAGQQIDETTKMADFHPDITKDYRGGSFNLKNINTTLGFGAVVDDTNPTKDYRGEPRNVRIVIRMG